MCGNNINNRCGCSGSSSSLICNTNNTQIKELISIHGCKDTGTPETTVCSPSFVVANLIEGDYRYASVSKNGGPFEDIILMQEEPQGYVKFFEAIYMNDTKTGFAFLPLDTYVDTSSLNIELGVYNIGGLTSTGKAVSDYYPEGTEVNRLSYNYNDYLGPFEVVTDKNTLTFRANPDATSEYLDLFSILYNPSGLPSITIESCALLIPN